MPKTHLVIPILNNTVTTFELPVWHLSESAFFSQIQDEDYATLHRDAEEVYMPLVSAKTLCVYETAAIDEPIPNFAESLCTRLQFVFKTFSEVPILLSHAALIHKADQGKAELKESVQLLSPRYTNELLGKMFRFHEGTTPQAIHEWFTVVSEVVKKYPTVQITLSRFNSCLTRTEAFDKIIDLTISMESLIRSTAELKFKFALFHSFLVDRDPEKRAKDFELLQILYDARSSIVHGDSGNRSAKKKIAYAVDHIDEIIALAHESIKYYILFLFKKPDSGWQSHLEGLVLGSTQRITD